MSWGKIGARRMMYKWRNPYVTDRLIAYWDGTWNAGGGTHDASLGKCVNLGYGGTWDTPYTILTLSDDYAEVSADNVYLNLPEIVGSIQQQIATAWLSSGDGVTIEILFAISASYSRWICGTKGGGAGNIGSGGCALNGLGLKNYRTGYDFSLSTWNLQTVAISRDSYQFYINGNLVGNESTPDFSPNMTYATTMSFANGAMFRFRRWNFYMKQLTASEIAANYAVDKLRFNLP